MLCAHLNHTAKAYPRLDLTAFNDHMPGPGLGGNSSATTAGEKDAPVKMGRVPITEIATTMKKLFGRRKEPERVRAVRLPVDGFEHPFRDSEDRLVRYGKEHPRTVSVAFSLELQ